MIFEETNLKDAYVINLTPYFDKRGYFVRFYCKDEFKSIGFNKDIKQINQSFNAHKNTFRGFHYQIPPFSESKLVRCTSGKIIDFIIDIRKDSETYLKSFSIELSGKNSKMLLIPEGFAHGFLTLENSTSIIYFHTESYKSDFSYGLRFNDPALHINLPVIPEIVSDKDLSWPLIHERSFFGLDVHHNIVHH